MAGDEPSALSGKFLGVWLLWGKEDPQAFFLVASQLGIIGAGSSQLEFAEMGALGSMVNGKRPAS